MKDWPWYYFVLIAVFIFALFYLFYYKPKNNDLLSIRTNRENVQREVMQLKAKKRQLDKLESELQQLTATLKTLETIIPKKRETSEILRQTQELAQNSNLDIRIFRPQGEIQKEFYSDWPISIEITGNYHNLARFFARLSNFPRLFTVDEFSIKAHPNQSDTRTINATCTATTYIQREVQPKPKQKTKRGKR